MSDRREFGSYTIPYVIRNLKPRPWPTIVMRGCMLCSFASCGVVVILLMQGVPQEFEFLLLIPVLLGLVGSLSIACFLLAHRQVDKLLLGEVLETRPRKSRYGIDDIQRIEFVSSPEEDYRELGSLPHPHEARIVLRRVSGIRSISLLLSLADASRLREWAKQNGIQVAAAEIDV